MDLDSDETTRGIDTVVLHRISIPFIWAEWFGLGNHFEKVPKYQETPSFFKICMSIFPGTGSQNEFFPYVPPAAFSNGELEGRSPSKMQGGLGGGAAPPRMIYLYYYFILQYFQTHKVYQNGWSFSISRYTSYIRMVGPSVFPEKQVISEWLVLQYFQIHRSYQKAWSFSISRFTGHQNAWSFSISRFAG